MSARARRRAIPLLRAIGLYTPIAIARNRFREDDRTRWRALRQFRRNEGRTLSRVTGDGSGPKVLFAANGNPGLYRLRVEAMVAKTLEARGCRPVWALDTRNEVWHTEYLRAFGFREFVYVEDYEPDRGALQACAEELLAGADTLPDILKLEHNGYAVGFHAASRALNRLHRGRLDLSDADVRAEFRLWLTNSLVAAVVADGLIAHVRPDKYVATAQNLTPWAELYEGALRAGIDTLYWMHSPLHNAYLWRRYSHEDRHEHYFTLVPETWEWARRMPWSQADAAQFINGLRESYLSGDWFHRKKTLKGKRVKTGEEIIAGLGLDPNKKTAFVFSHVLYDATFWFGANLFSDYADWLVQTVQAAVANPNVNWVVKLHPENVQRTEEAVGRYELENLEEYQILRELYPDGLPEHVKLMTPEDDTNTLSLFEFADYAITVRGTIGLEFPVFGVPTLTAGTGGYSGRGFTIDSPSAQEYLARLAHIEDIPPMSADETALAQRFSYGVFRLKPVPFASFEHVLLPDEEWDRGWDGHSFALHVRSAAEFVAAADLTRFAEWALASTSRDLLAPEADARRASVGGERAA